MAFPSNPTLGQTTTKNNITYVFDGTGWTKQGAVATASPVASVAGRTGTITLTAADIGAGTLSGALSVSGNLSVGSSLSVTGSASLSSTLMVSGNYVYASDGSSGLNLNTTSKKANRTFAGWSFDEEGGVMTPVGRTRIVFGPTGSNQTWTAPSTGYAYVKLWGAGGGGGNSGGWNFGAPGGGGGHTHGLIPVTAGTVYYIVVGVGGQSLWPNGTTLGYGGGGGGGYYGGGGGAYSEPNTMAGGGGGSGFVASSVLFGGTFTGSQQHPSFFWDNDLPTSTDSYRNSAKYGYGGDVGYTGTVNGFTAYGGSGYCVIYY